ncbi:MAG: AAA family ATPase [Lachnospiraceae bacterium]|nr:AAA family ATPase [Lachnospiraceae bacterium]
MIIHIYGAAGSGTSTLGRKICKELGYKFMDTDDYFWLPTNPQYTVKREKSERIRLMREEMESAKNVVISGSLVDWGDELIPFFDLAIRLVTDTNIQMERLKKREREKFGERIAPGGDMYESHLEFLEWAKEYDTGSIDMRSKAKHDEWQKLLQCPQIVLDGAGDLDENFRVVKVEILK